MAMKYNPFKPNGMVAPGMFAGRAEEIRAIEQCLFQAKHGNPQHFLIEGERGIGKSSLFYLVSITASGRIPMADGAKMTFLAISVDLGGVHTQIEIIRTVARGLRDALGERDVLTENVKRIWEWLTNWEVLGVRYHRDVEDVDPLEAVDELVIKLSETCSLLREEVDGVLILIDEADRPSEEAGLGEFLKTFTERLY